MQRFVPFALAFALSVKTDRLHRRPYFSCLARSLRYSARLARNVVPLHHCDDPVVEDALSVDSENEVKVAERTRSDTLVYSDGGNTSPYLVDVLWLGQSVSVAPEYRHGSGDFFQGIAWRRRLPEKISVGIGGALLLRTG